MNITNVTHRTAPLTIKFAGQETTLLVMPDAHTAEFEDMRNELVYDPSAKPSASIIYVIKQLVAKWDFVVTIFNEDGTPKKKGNEIVTRPLNPQDEKDIVQVPLALLYEITKGVREMNTPGEQKEEISESSFS